MRSTCKCWLNDGMVLGELPYGLLRAIEASGSLNRAAAAVGMSYRTAWVTLDRFEKTVGLNLVERKKGGVSGGGSRLTASGRRFVTHYGRFRAEITEAFEALFTKYFAV